MAHFELEQQLLANYPIIAGVDEAGRGPWSGPVVSAAVILDHDHINNAMNDSKKLSESRREALYDEIMHDHDVGIGVASVDEIDSINILNATKLSMKRAVETLNEAPNAVLVDGNQKIDISIYNQPVIKGDAISLSIAAASIIAKVYRDRLMKKLALEYPFYGWESNKGYGTKAHQEGLKTHGITMHHRKSFAPIKALLQPR